jgi:hypothetical protein
MSGGGWGSSGGPGGFVSPGLLPLSCGVMSSLEAQRANIFIMPQPASRTYRYVERERVADGWRHKTIEVNNAVEIDDSHEWIHTHLRDNTLCKCKKFCARRLEEKARVDIREWRQMWVARQSIQLCTNHKERSAVLTRLVHENFKLVAYDTATGLQYKLAAFLMDMPLCQQALCKVRS